MQGMEPTVRPVKALDPAKFRDPRITRDGQVRASVALSRIKTLWFNTGTLCNLTCVNCYIESSPRNDRLAYLEPADLEPHLDELQQADEGDAEIGFTGGEPFMNPSIIALMEHALVRGHRVLVLTNAMRPMARHKAALLALKERFDQRLVLRVSLDHYGEALHVAERGPKSWQPTIEGLVWLARHGFAVRVAGRTCWGESEADLRAGYARLFASLGIALDAADPSALVLFPEMNAALDVPEITTACWGILGKRPDAMMCATSRMVVKPKGEAGTTVMPCTLIPYDGRFAMGENLDQARGPVHLNHPHCARFCVLGGGSCSA